MTEPTPQAQTAANVEKLAAAVQRVAAHDPDTWPSKDDTPNPELTEALYDLYRSARTLTEQVAS